MIEKLFGMKLPSDSPNAMIVSGVVVFGGLYWMATTFNTGMPVLVGGMIFLAVLFRQMGRGTGG